ncbi:MAG: hypothetical protein U0172_04885 [Nitrospiraceae bacterium]
MAKMSDISGNVCIAAFALVAMSAVGGAAVAQQTMPIKDILLNPSAYHRQAVVLHGVVEHPGEMRGMNAWGQPLCGQQFTLNDETGQIPVRTVVACKSGDDSEWRLAPGESVTLEATMDAAPSNMRTITGRGLGISALVTRIIRDPNSTPHISFDRSH